MRSWWGLLWLAMALAVAAPVSAAVDEQALEAQQAASVRLIALVSEADRAEGDRAERLTRLRTAEFASLIRVVSDEDRLVGSEPLPVADLGRAFDTCGRVQGVMTAMMYFDGDADGAGKDGATTGDELPAVMTMLDRNTVEFQDELSVLQPFLLRCMAWLLPAMSEFVASLTPQDWTPVRRDGMRKMRRGVVVLYTGAIQVLYAESLRDGYKRAIMDSLVEHADVYAAASSLVDRRLIVDVLRAQRGKVPAAHVAGIDRLIAAYSTTACTGLCAIE